MIWVPSWENRDLRHLLWHRHRIMQARTRIMNQLRAVSLNEGLHCRKQLWREAGREQLESFALARGPVDDAAICWSCWID
jgi:transposase